MKKTLLLLASAALLLAGCAKEQIAVSDNEGGLVNATFTASLDSGVATKAAVDGDGAAASVNRCIMEIYYGDALFTRQYAKVENKVATFRVQVVSNRKYKVAFWADCVDFANVAPTEEELVIDKYYTTNATGGLQSISIKKITDEQLYIGNNDARDAFYHVGEYTVEQAGFSKDDIKLYRPFAQMNVITTDWDKANKVTGLSPEKVEVTIKNALVNFNAVTGEASGSQTLKYEAAVYTPAAHGAEKTLSMDYLFAPKTDKAFIDIDWKALHGTDANVEHSFAAVPYQRNYRTNIKGALLTTTGQWKVTVEPTWTDPEYTHPVVIATTLAEAQAALGPGSSETEAAGTVIVKPEAVTNRDQSKDKDSEYIETNTPGIELPDGAKAIEFVLTPQSKKDVTFELPALPSDTETEKFYWYIRHEDGYPTENLNIKVDSNDATRVIVDAPNETHVVLNDVVYAHVVAITGENTLVVPQGITVQKLTVKKGGVEIHGTVAELEITGAKEDVFFRACEGLSATVFEKIYKESDNINYIDPMYAYKRVGDNYDIYKLPVVAMIGEKEYPSIAAAVAAVPADNTQLVTIKVMSDVVLKEADKLTINKNNVVLDGQGYTIALDENDSELAKHHVNSTDTENRKYGKFQMIKVSGNDVTLKNLTLDSKNYRGASLATTSGGKNVSYENIVYKGLGSGHYYGSAGGDGTLKFKDCTFETHGYAIHTAECQSVLEVSDCEIHGWVSYGDKTKSATFTNTHFYSTTDQYNGVIATIRPYCATTITNCTFSKEYLTKYKYDGLTVRGNVVVSLKGCSVEEGELCDIANITCPDDPWIDGGVMAIDATGNATDGFTAGTFVAKQASDIKAAAKHTVTAVDGKEYVFTIEGVMTPGTYSISTAAQLVSFADRYNNNSEAGDYVLKLNPGTYETANIILVQQPGKTLTIQSSDANNKAILKTNSTEDKQAMFAICSESSYSGGAISFLNLAFDNSTLDSGKESYMFYAAGGGSGLVDGLISALRPGDQAAHRYVHDITIDGCNAVSNGVKAQFYYACSGNSGTTIKNCTFDNIGYIANGAFSHGGGREFGLKAINCKVTSSKVFINNQVADTEKTVVTYVEGCDVSAYHDYTIRIQGGHLTVKDTDFSASYTNTTMPGEAGIIVVGDADKYKSSIIDVDNQCTFSKTDSNLPDLYVGKECTVNGQAVTGKMNFSF